MAVGDCNVIPEFANYYFSRKIFKLEKHASVALGG